MVNFARFMRGALPLLGCVSLGVAALPAPAMAQFSKSYEFLDAVKKKDGQKVTDALSQPGTTMVNTQDSSNGQTALYIVTQRHDTTWMQFMIAKGADVNLKDNRGVSPLELAASLGFVEGVQLLVNAGARVDEPDATGATPLILAVQQRDVGMVKVLLKAGANPDRADSTGRTARDYAKQVDRSGALTNAIDATDKERKPQAGGNYGPSL